MVRPRVRGANVEPMGHQGEVESGARRFEVEPGD